MIRKSTILALIILSYSIIIIPSLLILTNCQNITGNSHSKIRVLMFEARLIENFVFKFVKVDTVLNAPVMDEDKILNVSFIQPDNWGNFNPPQYHYPGGTYELTNTITAYLTLIDDWILIEYESEKLTTGTWYLTISSKFYGNPKRSKYSKPAWFKIKSTEE